MKIIKPALVMIGFCLLWTAQAQSDNATKFADELAAFLRTEGYRATVSQDGYTVSFSYGDDSHIVKAEWEDPLYFVFINKAGYSLEGEAGFELNASILACNEVNREMESVKLYCGESRVMFNIEQYTRSFENLKSVFFENIDRLAEADERFIEFYNGFTGEDSAKEPVNRIDDTGSQRSSGTDRQELNFSFKGMERDRRSPVIIYLDDILIGETNYGKGFQFKYEDTKPGVHRLRVIWTNQEWNGIIITSEQRDFVFEYRNVKTGFGYKSTFELVK